MQILRLYFAVGFGYGLRGLLHEGYDWHGWLEAEVFLVMAILLWPLSMWNALQEDKEDEED